MIVKQWSKYLKHLILLWTVKSLVKTESKFLYSKETILHFYMNVKHIKKCSSFVKIHLSLQSTKYKGIFCYTLGQESIFYLLALTLKNFIKQFSISQRKILSMKCPRNISAVFASGKLSNLFFISQYQFFDQMRKKSFFWQVKKAIL